MFRWLLRGCQNRVMKISMMLNYAGDVNAAAAEVIALEKAGVEAVWVPEAYSFDAISIMVGWPPRPLRWKSGRPLSTCTAARPPCSP